MSEPVIQADQLDKELLGNAWQAFCGLPIWAILLMAAPIAVHSIFYPFCRALFPEGPLGMLVWFLYEILGYYLLALGSTTLAWQAVQAKALNPRKAFRLDQRLIPYLLVISPSLLFSQALNFQTSFLNAPHPKGSLTPMGVIFATGFVLLPGCIYLRLRLLPGLFLAVDGKANPVRRSWQMTQDRVGDLLHFMLKASAPFYLVIALLVVIGWKMQWPAGSWADGREVAYFGAYLAIILIEVYCTLAAAAYAKHHWLHSRPRNHS